MAFVIADPCRDSMDASCVEVCPVDCIDAGSDQYFINPAECINCAACVDVCPSRAIFSAERIPERWQQFVALNADFFAI